ncbi:MAG: hypothetical protein HYV59_16210 [Planctomycetes bacterium]|nr:hypothetical protein [Planctomycetota bacterium]
MQIITEISIELLIHDKLKHIGFSIIYDTFIALYEDKRISFLKLNP